jgi:Domain of unknown function (DUF4082)
MHKLLRAPAPLPAAGGGVQVWTLFGQAGGAGAAAADTAAYTMGVQFSVSKAGTLQAVWFNSPPGAVSLPSSIALYQVTGPGAGTLVASQVAAWSGAAGSGWVRAAFTVPPALTAGQAYKACVGNFDGNFFYGATASYWSSGPGAGGVTSGPVSAPANGGADGGQDTFTQAAVLSYPASSFNASNYWVDPEVLA